VADGSPRRDIVSKRPGSRSHSGGSGGQPNGGSSADGEAGKPLGNETIRVHPEEGWLELKLPAPLAHLANHPHGRYRLACPVRFIHRADE
jgi:hypothetical protein